MNFKKKTRPQNLDKKQEKKGILNSLYASLKVEKKFLILLKAK